MISVLQTISIPDLRALTEAIESGRLSPPFTALSLGRYCQPAQSTALADELQRLIEYGATPESLHFFLKILLDERTGRLQVEDLVDLVTTGPEVGGTTNRDTSVVVRELFATANESVMIAGYAIHGGKEVLRALADRMEEIPSLKVKMFLDIQRPYRDSTEASQLVWQFAHRFKSSQWPGSTMPEIYYYPRSLEMETATRASLHAKCIVVDDALAFVSSANFTTAAQLKNIEVGVLVRSERFARQLSRHFESLASKGVVVTLPGL